MAQEVADGPDDSEQVKRRFEEFRNTQTSRGRLPDAFCEEAAEAARRYGLNPTAQALRLDYNRLKKRMAEPRGCAERKKEERSAPAFVELIGPAPISATLTSRPKWLTRPLAVRADLSCAGPLSERPAVR